MAVKGSSTAARVLTVFEAVAAHQPIGVAALARTLELDKSAVQRALVTLAEQGWIQARDDPATRWETAPRILAVLGGSHARAEQRRRTQQVLDRLAVDTGETAIFNEPDGPHLVVSQVAESRQPLRMVPRIGARIPAGASATGRVLLPLLTAERRAELLGGQPDDRLRALLEQARERGYAASGEVDAPSMTIAAAVLGPTGHPIGAVAISGPAERMTPHEHPRLAALVCRAAEELSAG